MSKAPTKVKNRKVASPKPDSAPSGGSKSTAQKVRESNQWRDNYNPLRGLVISRVVSLLEAADRGDYAELQLTLRKIEKRYPVLKALKARRTSAIEKLDWEIKCVDVEKLPAGYTEAQADAQKEFLRSRYEAITNLTDVFHQLVLADFRGFAVMQKHRYEGGPNDGGVRELHWLPQWTWSRDGQFGDFYYNEKSSFGVGIGNCASTLGEANRIGSADLPRSEFVMREVDDALFEIALIAFVNWCMGRKDYAAFVEIFGLPSSVVIMPANIQAGKEDEYQTAAEKVAENTSGALPAGSDVKFPSATVRGNAPFKEFCDVQDADVVLAGTGGLLTMLSMPTGIGQGASGEHGDAFADIAQADARRINETLQRDFDKVELATAFPNQPVLAYFELCAREEEDVKEICANVLTLAQAGYKVKAETVEEKTGLELEDGDELPEVPEDSANQESKIQNPESKMEQPAQMRNRRQLRNRSQISNPESQIATAVADTLAPVLKRLDAIAKVEDAALQQSLLEKLLADFPALTEALAADESLAQVIAPQLQAGIIAGLKGTQPA